MRERAKELKAESKANASRADGERGTSSRRSPRCRQRIASWPSGSTSFHLRHRAAARTEDLGSGMPAYTRDGKIVCFFKAASKFESRYATFGFEEDGKPTTVPCGRPRGRSRS